MISRLVFVEAGEDRIGPVVEEVGRDPDEVHFSNGGGGSKTALLIWRAPRISLDESRSAAYAEAARAGSVLFGG